MAANRLEAKRLTERIELLALSAKEWEQRAKSAARAGDDVVASESIARKGEIERSLDDLRAALHEHRAGPGAGEAAAPIKPLAKAPAHPALALSAGANAARSRTKR